MLDPASAPAFCGYTRVTPRAACSGDHASKLADANEDLHVCEWRPGALAALGHFARVSLFAVHQAFSFDIVADGYNEPTWLFAFLEIPDGVPAWMSADHRHVDEP